MDLIWFPGEHLPEGAIPVMMRVGELPERAIGWVDRGRGNLPELLRAAADFIEVEEQSLDLYNEGHEDV